MLIDLIFPEICVGCSVYTSSIKHPYLCRSCYSSIPIRQGSVCIGCNQPVSNGITCFLCKKDNWVDVLYSVSDYNHEITANIIECIKYKFVKDALGGPINKLCAYLDKKVKAGKESPFLENSLIVPVPLHKLRLNWRGFNQSEIIAQKIAHKYLQLCDTGSLTRVYSRKPQAEINYREQRICNTKNCFSILNHNLIKNKDILLIDDVCTTGATLNECARVLKKAGARTVKALVIARSQI